MRKLSFLLILATPVHSPAAFAQATATGKTTVTIGARGRDHSCERLQFSLWDDVHGQRDVTSEGVR